MLLKLRVNFERMKDNANQSGLGDTRFISTRYRTCRMNACPRLYNDWQWIAYEQFNVYYFADKSGINPRIPGQMESPVGLA